MKLIPSKNQWTKWSMLSKTGYISSVIAVLSVPPLLVWYSTNIQEFFRVSEPIMAEEIPIHDLQLEADSTYQDIVLDSVGMRSRTDSLIMGKKSVKSENNELQAGNILNLEKVEERFEMDFPVETFTVTNYTQDPMIITDLMIQTVSFAKLLRSEEPLEMLPEVQYKVGLKQEVNRYKADLPFVLKIPPKDSRAVDVLFYTEFLDKKIPPYYIGKFSFKVWFETERSGITSDTLLVIL